MQNNIDKSKKITELAPLVIFLDIDGVLNYTKWYTSERNPGNLNGEEGDLDPECINRIIKICNETGAKVVISSDWRISWYGTQYRLGRVGLDENYVIDKTPEYIWRCLNKHDYFNDNYEEKYEYSRGAEIDGWLKEHPEVINYVIIDDRTDFTDEQKEHFVHVDPMWGLNDEHVQLAINILNHENI